MLPEGYKPKVLITIPTTGWVHKCCVFSIVRLLNDRRVVVDYTLPTDRPYESNLNGIVKYFLKTSFDYWITFDSDNPPIKNILDLVFLDLDIVGCPTPVWANMKNGDFPMYWNALDEKPDGWTPHKPLDGLQKVDAVGSGCMVIARRVLEKMEKPLFFRKWDKDGIAIEGHDYNFCRKAKDQGFKVWAHYDYPCYHFNEIEVHETAQAYKAAVDA